MGIDSLGGTVFFQVRLCTPLQTIKYGKASHCQSLQWKKAQDCRCERENIFLVKEVNQVN